MSKMFLQNNKVVAVCHIGDLEIQPGDYQQKEVRRQFAETLLKEQGTNEIVLKKGRTGKRKNDWEIKELPANPKAGKQQEIQSAYEQEKQLISEQDNAQYAQAIGALELKRVKLTKQLEEAKTPEEVEAISWESP